MYVQKAKDAIVNGLEFKSLDKNIKDFIDQKILLTKKIDNARAKQYKMLKPILKLCVDMAKTNEKVNCPETIENHYNGWCDDCKCEDICPSYKKTWSD